MYNKIKQAIISRIRADVTKYPQTIASYKGKEQEAVRQSVYGVCSVPPRSSLGLLFAIEGMGGVQYGIFDYPTGRFKNLTEGEVQVGNYLTQTYIKFDASGNVTIVASGDLTANVSGTTTINSNTVINGDLTVSGDVTATDYNSTAIGVSYNTHIHTGDSGGDTGTPK